MKLCLVYLIVSFIGFICTESIAVQKSENTIEIGAEQKQNRKESGNLNNVTMETQRRVDQLENATQTRFNDVKVEMIDINQRLNATDGIQSKLDNIESLLVSLLNQYHARTLEDTRQTKKIYNDGTRTELTMEKYPPPLPRMMVMEGKRGYHSERLAMCSPRGDYQITSNNLHLSTWKDLLTSKDSKASFFPDLILPTYLGGGVLTFWLQKSTNLPQIEVRVHFHSSTYNQQNVRVPMELGIALYFFQMGSRVPLVTKQGRVTIQKVGPEYAVFNITTYPFIPEKHVKIYLLFYK